MAKARALLGGKLLNPTEFLSSVELDGDLTLTITAVQHDKLFREGQRDPETKATVTFKGGRKLVLNRTNEDVIVRLHGSDAGKWVGKQITLYATTTRLGRDTVPCIRIRETVADQPLGKGAAQKLMDRLSESGRDITELEQALGLSGDPASWPKSKGPEIRKWLDSPPAQP